MELFEQLSPSYPPLSCSDRLVYDVEAYYRAAGLIMSRPRAERRGVDHETNHFVTRLIGLMTHPAQVPHVAQIVSALPETEMQNALPVFIDALPRVQRDTRAFEVFASETFRPIGKLARTSQEKAIANAGLIEATRTYLINQTSGEDCAFNGDHQKTWLRSFSQLSQFIYPPDAPRRELAEGELRRRGTAASHTPAFFWQSNASRDLLADFKTIRNSQSNSPEKAHRFGEYLSQVDLWPGADEDQAIYFHEKFILMEGVLKEEVLDADDRKRGLLSLMGFIAQEQFKSLGPEWLAQARNMLPLLERYGPIPVTDPVLLMYQSLDGRIAQINGGK